MSTVKLSTNKKCIRFIIYVILLLLTIVHLNAVPIIQNSYSYDEIDKLIASDANKSDNFGYSVSISSAIYGDDVDSTKKKDSRTYETDV